MPFKELPENQRVKAIALLKEWLSRPKHKDTVPGKPMYYYLVGSAARYAKHGPPPNRWQRLGYRTAKRNRARKAMKELYGDPTKENPKG